jgi:hypothetical protein
VTFNAILYNILAFSPFRSDSVPTKIIGGKPTEIYSPVKVTEKTSSPKETDWLNNCSDVFLMHGNFNLVDCLLPRSRQTKNWHQQLDCWVGWTNQMITNSPSSTDHRTRRMKPDGRQVNGQLDTIHFNWPHAFKLEVRRTNLTRRQASISPPTSQTPDQSPMLWFGSEKPDYETLQIGKCSKSAIHRLCRSNRSFEVKESVTSFRSFLKTSCCY